MARRLRWIHREIRLSKSTGNAHETENESLAGIFGRSERNDAATSATAELECPVALACFDHRRCRKLVYKDTRLDFFACFRN